MFDLVNFLLLLGYSALASVIMVILAPTPLHMIFFGVLFYLSFGCFFVSAGYDFIGVLLIIVYAGALMVMLLFVIMAFDLARSTIITEAVPSSRRALYWVRLVFFLILVGSALYVFSIWCLPLFLPDGSLTFVGRDIRAPSLFYDSGVFLISVLSCVSFTFYQDSFVLLVLCGALLCLSLVGAVGLTYGTSFLPLKRRLSFFFRYPLSIQRRVVLLLG